MNFVFYDAEATGPEPRHDQMLHVAAVLADGDLEERECFSLRSRLKPHQLPTPMALLLTGLSVQAVTDPALPSHDEMVHDLHRRFSAWQPAIFTGYSSLEFDEELLAHSLRASLLPPRLTTAPGNARLDVQRLALAVETFAPGAIAFTRRHDGAPSFRLSELARANGIAHPNAHDALGDVRTTLALARLIRSSVPWLWDHMVEMGRADAAAGFASSHPVRLYTEFHHNRPHHWLVTALGNGTDGLVEVVGFDLERDPEKGRALSGEALRRWVSRNPKPIRPIRVAECPFILPRERAAGLPGIPRFDDEELDRRAALLAADAGYRSRLIAAYAETARNREIPDDTYAPISFHAATWPDRASMAKAFAEPGLRARALRLIFDERPDLLQESTRMRFESETAARLLESKDNVPWTTLTRAFDATDAAFEHAATEDVDRLEGLIAYLKKELAWAEALDQSRLKPNS
ncbi:exonuclease domain-containing protein [Aestuariivirga sp.]|uniref:exonuclease domain-containing protein n=1 Tax=Aestuariivirga sp. TaxID=2650926 RepID=UPI00391A88EF